MLSPSPTETVGRVGTPPRKEATSEKFFFWIDQDAVVERGQIVVTQVPLPDETVTVYALVEEVYQQSRFSSLAEEHDRYLQGEPPYEVPGVKYAEAVITRTDPHLDCPPPSGAPVTVGTAEDAEKAYSADRIRNRLAVGLICNGARRTAGPGHIDLDDLLGVNGGHLNVNGIAGRGTKSSFLLHMIALLLRQARREQRDRPGDPRRLKIVPIVFNVKNFDLFHIDKWSSEFNGESHRNDWDQLGIDDPAPFEDATFHAPAQPGQEIPVDTGRIDNDVRPYSYSLADIIEQGLFRYLFAETDTRTQTFDALARGVEEKLTKTTLQRNGTTERTLREVGTFEELEEAMQTWSRGGSPFVHGEQHAATVAMMTRRLRGVLLEGAGVLKRDEQTGQPLRLTATETAGPQIVDLSSLSATPNLQRFVVGAIFRQLVRDRTGSNVIPGLIYTVTLDELNRFAPKSGSDPITRLIERVAAEMRSQGVILFGAQQNASQVSMRVIENAALRVIGRSGSRELSGEVWKFLSAHHQHQAMRLGPEEKLLVQAAIGEPMRLRIPFPPYALRGAEAVVGDPSPHDDDFDAV